MLVQASLSAVAAAALSCVEPPGVSAAHQGIVIPVARGPREHWGDIAGDTLALRDAVSALCTRGDAATGAATRKALWGAGCGDSVFAVLCAVLDACSPPAAAQATLDTLALLCGGQEPEGSYLDRVTADLLAEWCLVVDAVFATFAVHAGVVGSVLRLYGHLARCERARAALIAQLGVATTALSVHAAVPQVAVSALAFLANLSSAACNRAPLLAQLAVVLGTMRAHPSVADVSRYGLGLFVNLSTHAPSDRQLMAKRRVAVACLKEHAADVRVVSYALQFLCNLSGRIDNLGRLVDTSGLWDLVVAAQAAHADNAEAARLCKLLLARMSAW